MKYVPAPHHSASIDWLINRDYAALWLDMSSGKTGATATVIDQLLDKVAVSRWLVVSTPRIARVVWEDELQKWDHLNYLSGRYYHIAAEDLPVERVKVTKRVKGQMQEQSILRLTNSKDSRWNLLRRRAEVFTIHFDLVPRLVKLFGDEWPFDGVVLDESSLVAETDTERHRALTRVRGHIKRLYELTGTPSGNGLEKLFGQIKLMDGGKRLGRTLTEFRERFMQPGTMIDRKSGKEKPAIDRQTGRVWKWEPRPGAREAIYDAVKDICLSIDPGEWTKMPEIVYNRILVDLPPAARATYVEIEKEYIATLQNGAVVEASTAAVLANKLLQICSGAVYTEGGNWEHVHDAKLEAVKELREVTDTPILMAYWFGHELVRLQQTNKDAVNIKDDEAFEANWNAGKIPLGLIQPASGGHGLNLQAGGHIACWFGPIHNLELYLQFNKRLPRPGQQAGTVIIHHIIARDTLEEDVLDVNIADKAEEQDALLLAVQRRVNKITGKAE